MTIYEPAEDSYLLSEQVKKHLSSINNKKIKILDMGSGSGIQAQTCRKLGFDNILAADINPEVISHLEHAGFSVVKTNLFSEISKKEKFDLIIFNPPYLPEDKREPKDSRLATTAGKQGYELIVKFLEQAKEHLIHKGTILLLFSSLSKPKTILASAKKLGYNSKELSKEKLFFEELYVYGMKVG